MKLSLLCIKQNSFRDHGDEVGVFPFLCFFVFYGYKRIIIVSIVLYYFFLVINCYQLFSMLLKWKNLNYPKPG